MRMLLFAALLLTAPAFGAFQNKRPTAPSPSPAATPAPASASPRWKGQIEARYNGSFLNYEDEARKSSFLLLGQAVFRASDWVTIQGTWGFNQILEPRQEFTLTNPEFRMFYKAATSKSGWSWLIGPTAALPLSQDAQDQSLYFAIGAASRVIYNAQDADDVGFKIHYDLGLNRNVHHYETSSAGDLNTIFSIDHYVEGAYAFDGPFSVSAWLGFSSAWTYTGDINNNYTLGQELDWAFADPFEVGIGHERGGDFLSPNGQAYNFGLFDPQESRFYLLLRLSL